MGMNFTEPSYYFAFLPAAILFVWLTRRKVGSQLRVLLMMSYIFFILASGWHLILLITSTIVDWAAGGKIHNSEDEGIRKRWLILSIGTNLSLLGLFKYLDFIIRSLGIGALKIGIDIGVEEIGLLLPVGISFYTFQTMSYTIDIYRRKGTPADSFVEFACYAAFFPQLVAGPIVRFSEFRTQLSGPLSLERSRAKLAITLIVYGIVKKFVFADNFAFQVNAIFVDGAPLDNPVLIYWGALLFGLQIFCDFSAYTDIALGSAHLFGIKLPENFKSPYKSRTPREFWRRWHISLSTWLRDYLYISLGGSRNGKIRMYLALSVTMALGGLWHGASWNFVLWGCIHGTILIAHRIISETKYNMGLRKSLPRAHSIFSWVATQWLIFLSWLIFRIEDTSMLIRSIKTYCLIDLDQDVGGALNFLPGRNNVTFVLLVFFIIFHGLSSLSDGSLKYRIVELGQNKWGALMGAMLTIAIILRPTETVEFIYFRF